MLTFRRILSFVCSAFFVLALAIQFQPSTSLAQTPFGPRSEKNSKLSTPLVLLSMNVQQAKVRPATPEEIRPPQGFSKGNLPKPLKDAVHAGQLKITDKGEVQVYIEMNSITPQNLDELRSYGVTVQIIGEPKPDKSKGEVLTKVPTVQGLLPITMINQVSALPFVRYIRLPDYGFTNTGSVESQGDAILQATAARSQFGVDGTGIRVGVISNGIGGIFAMGCTSCGPTTQTPSPITLGDLPNATGTRNSSGILTSVSGGITAQSFPSSAPNLEPPASDTASGLGSEGTAMLEIVHDLAPGAQLYFANPSDNSCLSIEQAVDWITSNTDVSVDDLSCQTPPFDGTSALSSNTATDLNTDTKPIRGYFTAVANQVFDHWGEPWTDSGKTFTLGCPTGGTTETGNVQLFQATTNTKDSGTLGPYLANPLPLTMPNGASIQVILTWNDPVSGSSNDYDLFLYSVQNGNLIAPLACSVNPQTGTQPPIEVLSYQNTTGAAQEVGILIQNVNNAASARNFDLFVNGYMGNSLDMNFYTPSGSVPAESDAGGSPVSVVSVGAIDQTQCTSSGICTGSVEPYSSQGPTEATPQAQSRMKPDVAATDGVSVTGAGGFGVNPGNGSQPCPIGTTPCSFFGSSAAAPHAAAVAALALQAAPCLLSSSSVNKPATARANLRKFLTGTAVPLPGIAQAAPNNIEGFGLLNALAAITATLPTVNAGASQTVNGVSANGTSVTLNGSATDPDSCPVTLSWAGSCGTASGASTSLMCPVGNDTETLTASNGGVTASLPTSAVQVTVSDFSVASPQGTATVKAGQSATYTISVGQQFGAFTNAVSLACSGLPSLASCSFSPSSVTPGSGSTTSTLTVMTTAASLMLPARPSNRPTLPMVALWLSVFLTFIIAAFWAKKDKRKFAFRFASCVLLTCIALAIASCGNGSKGPSNPGTPAGTYTVSVTGSSNQLQHSVNVTLVVQ